MLELNKIYQGDCLEMMKQTPKGSIDLIITSPPYNLGNGHHTGNKKTQAYNDNLPEAEYQKQQIGVLNECFRVLKNSGSMFYNHKNRIRKGVQITPYEWLSKTNFIIKQELVWFNGSQNFDKIRFYPMTERIYWLAKSPETKFNNVINHHDLFNKNEWPSVGSNNDWEHTRAFPEKLVESIITCFPEAETILDPYNGSGTITRVAQNLKRNFIGIEISPEYCEIARQRLRQQTLL